MLSFIVTWLLAALVVGWTTAMVAGESKFGRIADAGLGLVGGLLGGLLYAYMMEGQAIRWVSVLTAICGALSLLGARGNHAQPLL